MIPRKGNVSRTRCAQGTGRAHRLATGSRPSRRLICCARVVGAGWPHRCWLSVTARSASGKPSARCSRTPANRVAGGIGRPMCSLHCRSRRTPVRSRRCGRSRSTTTPSTKAVAKIVIDADVLPAFYKYPAEPGFTSEPPTPSSQPCHRPLALACPNRPVVMVTISSPWRHTAWQCRRVTPVAGSCCAGCAAGWRCPAALTIRPGGWRSSFGCHPHRPC